MKLLLVLLLAPIGVSQTFTATQVGFIDCSTAGCLGKLHDGDTTIFSAWPSTGTTLINGVSTPGYLYGTTNDSNINWNADTAQYGPNCSGGNIEWLRIPIIDTVSTIGSSGMVYSKNCMVSFGATPSDTAWAPATSGTCSSGNVNICDWKSNGEICVDGTCYLNVFRQETAGGTLPWYGHDATLVKTVDGGTTWRNPAHVGSSANANGDAPAGPGDASYPASIMWPDPVSHNGLDQHMGRLEFMQYGQDGATWPNVDNNGTYIYAWSWSGAMASGAGGMYLSRAIRANMANLSPSDWSYYVCPGYLTAVCDGSNNANWSATMANGTAILTAMQTGLGGCFYSSELHVYICSGGQNNAVAINTAAHPWGRWTLQQIPGATIGFVTPILATLQTITPSRTIQFTATGTYNGKLAYITYQIDGEAPPGSAVSGAVRISGGATVQVQ